MIVNFQVEKIRRKRRKEGVGTSILDIASIKKNVDLFTQKRCVMDNLKGNVRTIVAQKGIQKHASGLQVKQAAEEMRSATSLMILLHQMIKGYRHTKKKSRPLNVLVVNLNGKKRIVLCNTHSMTRNYISALIVTIGYDTRNGFLIRAGLYLIKMET